MNKEPHMQKYLFVVLSNPVEGEEDRYNAFYDDQHVPDVLRVPGIRSSCRYVLTQAQRQAQPSPFKYLAIYEIETDDLAGVCAEIGRRSGTDDMPRNMFISQDPKFAYMFAPMGPVMTAGAPT